MLIHHILARPYLRFKIVLGINPYISVLLRDVKENGNHWGFDPTNDKAKFWSTKLPISGSENLLGMRKEGAP